MPALLCYLEETPFWCGIIIFSICFSATKDANPTRQRLEVKSADACSFDRTFEIRAEEEFGLRSAKSSPSFDFLELNYGCNSKALTREGLAKASPVAGDPLQKYQSLDFGSMLCGSCPDAPPINTAGRCHSSKGPVTRTKSTPFELIQPRKTNELDVEDGSSFLESQPPEPCLVELQAQRAVHVSSEELNYSLPCAAEHPTCDVPCVPQPSPKPFRVHSCMSLVEDPFFPPSPPNSADSKRSFDLPEKRDRASFPCTRLPASSTTSLSYCNSHESLAANPLTRSSPPLNQQTAIEGKLCSKICVTFWNLPVSIKYFGFFLPEPFSFSASFPSFFSSTKK